MAHSRLLGCFRWHRIREECYNPPGGYTKHTIGSPAASEQVGPHWGKGNVMAQHVLTAL